MPAAPVKVNVSVEDDAPVNVCPLPPPAAAHVVVEVDNIIFEVEAVHPTPVNVMLEAKFLATMLGEMVVDTVQTTLAQQ